MTKESLWVRLTTADRTLDELGLSLMEVIIDRLFKIKQRKSTISRELKCGVLHFVSCSFILAVNPSLLEPAGFETISVAAATALSAGVSSILCGFFSNLPFVLAPTTSTSIYFCIFLQNRSLSTGDGKVAVFILGILYSLCGIRPIALFITNIIPYVIKVGVCLGVGLLIALEALTEIGLVRTGEHTVLDIGSFTIEIYIAMFSFVVIGLALHYRVRGAFLIGLVFGTCLFWIATFLHINSTKDEKANPWPESIFIRNGEIDAGLQSLTTATLQNNVIYRLVFDLYIIGVILLNGLANGLAETAGLKRDDNTLPRGKWLYAICGVGTILSAILGSGPIMISPESAPGIKAGARTGLSSVMCGCLFLLSTTLSPIFASTPSSGTSPVLLMIGMMLFENAKNVNWSSVKEALPVFLMAIFIPFTYSIFNGVIFGFGIYLILFLFTEQELFHKKFRTLIKKLKTCCKAGCSSRRRRESGQQAYQHVPLGATAEGQHSTTSVFEGEGDVENTLKRDQLNSSFGSNLLNRRFKPKLKLDNDSSNSDSDDDDDDDSSSGISDYLFQSSNTNAPSLSFELNEISVSSPSKSPGNGSGSQGNGHGQGHGFAAVEEADHLQEDNTIMLYEALVPYEPLFLDPPHNNR